VIIDRYLIRNSQLNWLLNPGSQKNCNDSFSRAGASAEGFEIKIAAAILK
jgi:hypothetical protein